MGYRHEQDKTERAESAEMHRQGVGESCYKRRVASEITNCMAPESKMAAASDMWEWRPHATAANTGGGGGRAAKQTPTNRWDGASVSTLRTLFGENLISHFSAGKGSATGWPDKYHGTVSVALAALRPGLNLDSGWVHHLISALRVRSMSTRRRRAPLCDAVLRLFSLVGSTLEYQSPPVPACLEAFGHALLHPQWCPLAKQKRSRMMGTLCQWLAAGD